MADGEDGDDSSSDRPKAPKRSSPLAPDPKAYEQWWAAYRDGCRSPDVLRRIVKVSIHTIRHAIRHGWPGANLPALAARAELFDRQKTAAIQQAVKSKEQQAVVAIAEVVSGSAVAGSYDAMQRETFANLATMNRALAALAAKISEAAVKANFVRYREVPELGTDGLPKVGEDGKPIMVLRAEVDGPAVSATARMWALAQKDTAAVAKVLFGSLDDRESERGALADLPPMSADQLAKIRQGEIPDDLTDEQLAAALIEASRMSST
jgi:hypothetical protein